MVLQQDSKGGKGAALREALSLALSLVRDKTDNGAHYLCWQEPEKTDMVRLWRDAIDHALKDPAGPSCSKLPIVVPARSDASFRESPSRAGKCRCFISLIEFCFYAKELDQITGPFRVFWGSLSEQPCHRPKHSRLTGISALSVPSLCCIYISILRTSTRAGPGRAGPLPHARAVRG